MYPVARKGENNPGKMEYSEKQISEMRRNIGRIYKETWLVGPKQLFEKHGEHGQEMEKEEELTEAQYNGAWHNEFNLFQRYPC